MIANSAATMRLIIQNPSQTTQDEAPTHKFYYCSKHENHGIYLYFFCLIAIGDGAIVIVMDVPLV